MKIIKILILSVLFLILNGGSCIFNTDDPYGGLNKQLNPSPTESPSTE